MPNDFKLRDGTGQSNRRSAALSPDYFQIDERRDADLLAYARQLATIVRYYKLDGTEEGRWENFLGTEKQMPLNHVVAWQRDPDLFLYDAARRAWFSRPHFTLFLAFLELMRHVRGTMNDFTRRHLDFYYREILGFQTRPAEADSVHLLLELTKGVGQHAIPAGTLVAAGKKDDGQTRFFSTTADLVVNRTRIAEIRNLSVIRARQDLRQYYLTREDDTTRMVETLKLVYGSPLPDFNVPAVKIEKDEFFKNTLKPLLDFSENTLFLSLSELRRLMRLRDRRDVPGKPEADWTKISEILLEAGKKKSAAWPGFNAATDVKNFVGRFQEALGFNPLPPPLKLNEVDIHPIRTNFQGADNVFDLFELLEDSLAKQAAKDPTFDPVFLKKIEDFVAGSLLVGSLKVGLFLTTKRFHEMMRCLTDLRDDWRKINRWLTKAGSKKRNATFDPRWPELPSFLPQANFPNIAARLNDALALSATPPFNQTLAGFQINSLDSYFDALRKVDDYFGIPFEDVQFITNTIAAEADPAPVFALLEKAFKEKQTQQGLNVLKTTQNFPRTPAGLIRILEYALGEKPTNPTGPFEPWETINNQTTTATILQNLRKTNDSVSNRYISEKLFLSRLDFEFIASLHARFVANQSNPTDPKTPPPSDDEWNRLLRLVEEARRLKRQLPLRPPLQETFDGVFARADATTDTSTGKAWNTFGTLGAAENAAEIGFAVASPLLQLAEGDRTITLELTFSENLQTSQIQKLNEDLSYWLSTEEGWFPANRSGAPTGTGKTHQATLALAPTDPPIVRPPAAFFSEKIETPVLKIVLGKNATGWAALKNLVLQKVKITVEVGGLTPQVLENDQSPLDPAKPFEPFGAVPKKGSGFAFAHSELFKPLENIGFHFEWKGLIEDTFAKHYLNYGTTAPTEASATSFLRTFRKKTALPIPVKTAVGLFSGGTAITKSELPHRHFPFVVAADVQKITAERLEGWSRYFRLELQTDFLHTSYPAIAADKAREFAIEVEMNRNEANATTKKGKLDSSKTSTKINPPYTPDLNNFKIYYKSSEVILDLAAAIKIEPKGISHLYPFGCQEVRSEPDAPPRLLPDLPNDGELYIGLADCQPPQHLSLLFQMAEGSANPDLEKTPVRWSYLGPKGWTDFAPGEILADETEGFANSGLLRFALPATVASDNPLMPARLHWLRASIATNRESVCDVLAIHTQAVRAVRQLDLKNPAADDPGQALPPETIKSFFERQPGIKKLSQLYASFGGKSAESDAVLYTRAAERLRHRERALTLWDAERLVLEHFPDVYKAKCLPAENSEGEVRIVVVPDIRGKALFDTFKPKLAVNRLRDVEQFLQAHGSPLAVFRAVNPTYVSLEVQAFVRFRAGFDEAFYRARLDEELQRFLAPWAFDEGADIPIDSTIYASVIVNFMEERPYVDYVAGVKLFSKTDDAPGVDHATQDNNGVLQADKPEAIWVSARRHEIRLAEARPDQVSIDYEGIGVWRLEYDFEIANDTQIPTPIA